MTTNEIKDLQNSLECEVKSIAQNNKLTNNDHRWPIYDGIGNIDEYLQSYPKISVILKEPYDDFDAEKQPYGGGWSIPRDCFMKQDQKWTVLSWQRIIYTVYGLRNNLKYDEMDYIRDNYSMGDVLRSIAWINLNKMPARTHSSDGTYIELFKNYWKDIVKKQLELYSPDVVICGNVFGDCREELFSEAKPLHTIPAMENMKEISIYEKDKTLILDVAHPGIRYKSSEAIGHYIDSINNIIGNYFHL